MSVILVLDQKGSPLSGTDVYFWYPKQQDNVQKRAINNTSQQQQTALSQAGYPLQSLHIANREFTWNCIFPMKEEAPQFMVKVRYIVLFRKHLHCDLLVSISPRGTIKKYYSIRSAHITVRSISWLKLVEIFLDLQFCRQKRFLPLPSGGP